MRQLDLFGSFIDTPPEKKHEEERPVIIKKEHPVPSVSENEDISYSVVGLAEEMLGTQTTNDTKEVTVTLEVQVKSAEQSESETEFSSPGDIEKNLAGSITAERLQTTIDILPGNEIDVEKETNAAKQKETNQPETGRNGTLIFEDGKIAVKLKNKPVAADAAGTDTEIKVKKEPQKRGRKSLEEIEAEVDLIEVPEDEVLFQKQYYSISEVAKWFRVNTSLLRFWENEFDVLKPKKNRKGDRLFRPEDVKNLQLIYQLLRQRKYTIEGAKEYIKTHRKKADVQLQLTNTLHKFKSFLLDLKANM